MKPDFGGFCHIRNAINNQGGGEDLLKYTRAVLIVALFAIFMLQSFNSNSDSAFIWYKDGMCLHTL